MDKVKFQEFKNSFKVGQVLKIAYAESKNNTRKRKVRILKKYDNFILCDLGKYKGTFSYSDFLSGYVKVM